MSSTQKKISRRCRKAQSKATLFESKPPVRNSQSPKAKRQKNGDLESRPFKPGSTAAKSLGDSTEKRLKKSSPVWSNRKTEQKNQADTFLLEAVERLEEEVRVAQQEAEYATAMQFDTAYQSAREQALAILPDSATEGHEDFEAVRSLVQDLKKSNPQFFDNPRYPVLIAQMVLSRRSDSAQESRLETSCNAAPSNHPDIFHTWYKSDLPSIREQEWVNREFILECSLAREIFPDCTKLDSPLSKEISNYLSRNTDFLRGICGKPVIAVAAICAAKLNLSPAVTGGFDKPVFLPS